MSLNSARTACAGSVIFRAKPIPIAFTAESKSAKTIARWSFSCKPRSVTCLASCFVRICSMCTSFRRPLSGLSATGARRDNVRASSTLTSLFAATILWCICGLFMSVKLGIDCIPDTEELATTREALRPSLPCHAGLGTIVS